MVFSPVHTCDTLTKELIDDDALTRLLDNELELLELDDEDEELEQLLELDELLLEELLLEELLEQELDDVLGLNGVVRSSSHPCNNNPAKIQAIKKMLLRHGNLCIICI